MTCADVLATLREREPADSDPALLAHLEGCAACRTVHAEDEALIEALRSLPVPDPGTGHGTRFRRAVRDRLEDPVARGAGRPVLAGPGLVAAAAVLVAAVLLALAIHGRPERLVPTTVAAAAPPAAGRAVSGGMPSIGDVVQAEIEDLVAESWGSLEEEAGGQAWAAALTGDMDWIASLTEEDQLVLLMALDEG